MIINFTKLQGAGNGYIAIDGRDITISWGKLAIEMGASFRSWFRRDCSGRRF